MITHQFLVASTSTPQRGTPLSLAPVISPGNHLSTNATHRPTSTLGRGHQNRSSTDPRHPLGAQQFSAACLERLGKGCSSTSTTQTDYASKA